MGKQSIFNFYAKKNILITGGTGFLGVGFVEKLLRSFPQIGNIYLIIRSKKNISSKERQKNYFDNEVFLPLKNENGLDYGKVKWIEGDMLKNNLGLSDSTIKEIQNSTNVIFHCAAETNFLKPFKSVIRLNVQATNDLLNIAKNCNKLNSFMYVSSTYANAKNSVPHLEEKIYPNTWDPKKLLALTNSLSTQELNLKIKDLIQDWPNTYTFSKNVAENLCWSARNDIPVSVFRPGIIIHAYAEPFKYWVQGNTGFIRGFQEANNGFPLYLSPIVNANSVPIDMTVNGLIAAAYATAINYSRDNLKVYNFCTGSNPCTFLDGYSYFINSISDYKLRKESFTRKLEMFSKNIPLSYQDKIILDDYKNFQKFLESVNYFVKTPFTYDFKNVDDLWNGLSDEEKKLLFLTSKQ